MTEKKRVQVFLSDLTWHRENLLMANSGKACVKHGSSETFSNSELFWNRGKKKQ
jgi:hypothetical protein